MQNKPWIIKDILNWTTNYFKDRDIDAARITCELLLGKALSLPRINLYINYDRPLSQDELALFKSYIKRRVTGEPTQYIIGTQEFWSLTFKVSPAVLIPRADTEALVQAVIDDVRGKGAKSVSIIEIGTGSGAVSIAIARELQHLDLTIKAVDVSRKALEVAKENAAANGVGDIIDLVESDSFANIHDDERYDMIVSNPPYISREFFDTLDKTVKDHEPAIALYGGIDGLDFYKDIFVTGSKYLNQNGKIFVEIDYRKEPEIQALVAEGELSIIGAHKDIAGRNRVLELIKLGEST